MEGLSVTVVFDRDDPGFDDGELFGTTAKLCFFLNDTLFADMLLTEPHMFSSQNYLSFNCLTFCDSNGGVSITRKSVDTLLFEVSKFGAGGSGEISIKAPIEACRQAFQDLAKWRKTFE